MSCDRGRELTWLLPADGLNVAMAEMAMDGKHRREGVVLWLGTRANAAVRVTHVVLLRGDGVVRERDYLEISADLFNDVTDAALERAVLLVGQIHSHGGGWPTDLSPIDRRGGLHVPGYLSVVAPDYGLRRKTAITDCGVHVCEPGDGYRRLSVSEVKRRVSVVPEGVGILEVGR